MDDGRPVESTVDVLNQDGTKVEDNTLVDVNLKDGRTGEIKMALLSHSFRFVIPGWISKVWLPEHAKTKNDSKQ